MVGGLSLWSVGYAVLPVVLITYFLYHLVRPFWKVVVNCWFCNENVRVPYCNRKVFVCPRCGQYNGFREDGDYDRFIPEQRYECLNPAPKKKLNGMRESRPINLEDAANGLCQECNKLQARIQTQINKFEPRNEAYFDDEFKEYKARLHRTYPLCSDCEAFVRRKLKRDQEIHGSNGARTDRTPSMRSPSLRSSQFSQKLFSEVSRASQHSCTPRRRRRRAALFNCGPISNVLNLITFAISCSLFIGYFLQLQNEVDVDLLDISRLLPAYVLSSWLPFLMCHITKITILGLGTHVTSVAMMRARRSLPDIVAFFIWCALSLLNSSEGERKELFLSQLCFSSILCILSFSVAFLPRKLLHRKRPNNIIKSAFSIASTPASQCSTLSTRTSLGRNVSFSTSLLDRSASSREATPSRELGKMLDSLSLGNDPTPSKGMAILRQRRGPFDSMKKPVLAEPRLRLQAPRKDVFLDGGTRTASRYVRSLAPSSMTSLSAVPDSGKFTLFNVVCVLGTLFSVVLNAAMFYKLFYSAK